MIKYDESKFTSFGLNGVHVSYLVDKFNIVGGDYCNGIWIIPIEFHDAILAEVTPYSAFRRRVDDHYNPKVNGDQLFPAFGASGIVNF